MGLGREKERERESSAKMKHDSGRLLLVVDIAGTFLFGMEGAAAAIRGNLDLLGLLVLAFSTALAGGVVRDVLIGAVPPEAIRNWRYAVTAFAAATITFFFYRMVQAFPVQLLMILDAGGLASFAVAGTEKALDFKIHPFMAALLGTITGVGGGTIRDIFLAHVPRVLQSDIYATAALAGAVVLIALRKLGLSPMVAACAGGGVGTQGLAIFGRFQCSVAATTRSTKQEPPPGNR